MDDLLTHPGYYGLTITWTLFRGFTDLGPAMTDTWLLFLNSDFILADGSYRSLLQRLNANARIVLAPSYCTIEDEVVPLLRARVSAASHTLSIPPRDMADLMLAGCITRCGPRRSTAECTASSTSISST